MKKGIVLLVMLVFAFTLSAQTSNAESESLGAIAATDNFMAAKINPAAMGVGNSGGISYLGNYDKNGFDEDDYSLFFNFNNFAYVLDQNGRNSSHRLALSAPMEELFFNLYLGTSWDWNDKYFKEGKLSESILFRPTDYLSLGAVAHGFFDEETTYDFGVAVRPLIFDSKWTDRLTISVDTNFDRNDFTKPVVGLQTEIVDGIKLGGSYNMQEETIGLDFGISFGNFGIGSTIKTDTENKFSKGQYYLSTSDKAFRTIFGKNKNYFLDYKLKGEILEKNPAQKIGPFKIVMSKGKTLSGIIKEIEKLKNDDNVKGIIFKNSTISANFANLVEIKKALLDLKSAGKKIVFYDEGYGNIGYAFAASVADEIYLYKTGSVDLRGISINSPYIKKLMDKLGIEMTNFRSHKYKTAGNMFAETEMTEAERESYSYLLQGLYDEMKLMISEGRGDKLTSSVEDVINNGPYFIAQNAVDAGLIDGLIYEDELEEILKDKFGTGKINKKFSCEKARADWSEPIEEKIAVIYAIGNIHMGEGKPGKTIGSVTTAKAIKKAREDKSVKGIVLCVNSGGGSALASDIIGREVELCNDGENKKPVIALMTGTAASGGYYISAFADKIVAQPTTITGSIGVIGMIPNFEGLYEKIGVNWSSVKMGAHSDFASTNRKLTDDEYKHIEESIEHVYWEFVDIVAEGRGMTRAEVHEIARGRVWTGKQAQERGLVDEMGGMDKAIEELKKLANIQAEVNLIEFDGYNQNVFKFALDFDLKQKLNIPKEMEMLLEISDELQVYDGEKVLMMMPKIVVE